MASNDRLMQLIQSLRRETERGVIHWKRTASKEVYLANFPEYAVRITWEPKNMLASPSMDPKDYYVRIYNSNGDMVEEIAEDQLTKTPQFDPREAMMDIFTMARRQAMGADEAIEALLKVLQ